MSKTRFTVTPAVYIILRKEDKILMIRRANTGYRDGFYALPAGHIEENESATLTAVREAAEEIGVTIAPEKLKFAHVIHRLAEEGTHERVDFFFEAESWHGEPTNLEPHKCDDVRRFPIDKLPKNTTPLVRKVLGCIDDGIYFSEDNFKVDIG